MQNKDNMVSEPEHMNSQTQSAMHPINLEHLSHYTMGGQALAEEVLNLFRVQTRTYVENLRRCVDPAELKLATHTLKGSAQSVGADKLTECARQCEHILSSKIDGDWNLAVTELEAAFEEADAFIQNLSS